MDIVFCTATRDILILKKVIKYVWQNISPTHIYVITNRKNKYLFSPIFLKKYCISIIDENCLCEGLSFYKISKSFAKRGYNLRVGWYFQQFLKMGFSLSKYAKDEYLVWDSDTIPLRPLSFKNSEGKSIFTIKTEYHKPYFDTIQKLFGIGKCCEGSFIAEHMLINTLLMRKIIHHIESNNNKPWFEIIIDSINSQEPASFSEFETYGTYVSTFYPEVYAYQQVNTNREAGLSYGRCVTDKELALLAKDYDTVSFEAYHLPPKPRLYLCKIHSKFLELYSQFIK